MLGICNGFQIITEAGLLPGALLPNKTLKFHCKSVNLRVENSQSDLHVALSGRPGDQRAGRASRRQLFADDETLNRLEGEAASRSGIARRTARWTRLIIPTVGARHRRHLNETKTVLGLMPHPEDATHPLHATQDGAPFFAGLVEALN